MSAIPLFPLNSIVFPKGRVSLQIFEARYVDMIRQCMRDQSGFGVVLIESGSEVAQPGVRLDIHRVGTYCEVVDWNQLENGLLGITAEGRVTFNVVDTWREDNELCRAEVEFREYDGVNSEPMEVGEDFQDYVQLLRSLARHPAVEELKLDVSFDNLREIAWRLSELLPISKREKQGLLELENPLARLEQVDLYISALNK